MQHNRKSLRLKDYDYSKPGLYFVTICVKHELDLFGRINNGVLFPNKYGEIVIKSWLWIEKHYAQIQLDRWILMPNHLHGIIIIKNKEEWSMSSGGTRTATTGGLYKSKSLGRIIGAFKTVSTKQINLMRKTPGAKIWQRNYHDHIIRNKNEYFAIRQYIIENPKKWIRK